MGLRPGRRSSFLFLNSRQGCMQSLNIGLCLIEERFPILWRMAGFQHLLENSIRIVLILVCPFGFLVIYPDVYDDPAFVVEPKEQPVLLKEFGPKPMSSICPKGVSLSIFRSMRVLGNDLKCQLDYSRKAFCGIFLHITLWIFFSQGFNLGNKGFKLIQKQGVGVNGPATNDQRVFA